MAEVINLRAKRKEKKREEKSKQASENRSLYGESKNLKKLRKHEKTQIDKTLEGAKRGNPDTND